MAKSTTTNGSNTLKTTQVRVGLRIRPLTNNEKSSGGKAVITSNNQARTASIVNRKFTYDAVYDETISQSEMYQTIGGTGNGMLETFLDGYNTTIMAYGQTGSGKSFTMGSEAHYKSGPIGGSGNSPSDGIASHQGLIPRFMADVFSSLSCRKKQQQEDMNTSTTTTTATTQKDAQESSSSQSQTHLIDYKVSASFIEVYGEDIHDLLDDHRYTSEEHRPALPLREDGNGGVVVVGLKSRVVRSAEDALQVLHVGTLNRTTAATLMNEQSSRSHAVFTIDLEQTTRKIGDGNNNNNNTSEGGGCLDVTTVSRFTFVDLAGSERLKKTGAEGERAREGIEINMGLLALGNVINALADEDRLAKGEKVYVPYRQSKLTRLLQDALGGNSQTLFLACVSPSDSNVSETLSTLTYANRARNIKNAPTKNVDATVMELQRLHALTHVLERELVKCRFLENKGGGEEKKDVSSSSSSSSSGEDGNNSDEGGDELALGEASLDLLQRNDVQEYLQQLHSVAQEKQGSDCISTAVKSSNTVPLLQSKEGEGSSPIHLDVGLNSSTVNHKDRVSLAAERRKSTAEDIDNALLDVNPDEDMALLDKLLELQNLDQQFETEHQMDEEQLKKVDGELKDKEEILVQLKGNLKTYHHMKEKFESLMGEVQSLEAEKASLAAELERAQVDPTKGCSKAIKKRLETVEAGLARARKESKKQQQLYRKAEQDAQRCRVLQQKIEQLKYGKVNLIKKQRETAAKHRESTDAKSREIQSLKKRERKADHKMTKLEAEVEKHKANLNKRKAYSDKLGQKLKQTEMHLMKALAMRKRKFNERSKKVVEDKSVKKTDDGFAPKNEEISSLKYLLENFVSDKVSTSLLKSKYETKVAEYSDLMRTLVEEMKLLQEAQKMDKDSEEVTLKIQGHKDIVEDLELKIEVVEADLESIRSRLPELEDDDSENDKISKIEADTTKLIANLSAPIIKTLLLDCLDQLTKAQIDQSKLEEGRNRKDAALYSLENEVQVLNQQIVGLSKDFERRLENVASLTGNGELDVEESFNKLHEKIIELEKENKDYQNTNIKVKEEADIMKEQSKKAVAEKNHLLASANEKITVMEVALKNQGVDAAEKSEETLSKLQSIWNSIGVSMADRELIRQEIESCLEDTCVRTLKSAQDLKGKKESDLHSLYQTINVIYKALGRDEENDDARKVLASSRNLVEKITALQSIKSSIFPAYLSAIDRRQHIIEEVYAIKKVLDLSHDQLSNNIQSIMKHKRSKGDRRRTTRRPVTPSAKAGKEQRAKIFKDVEEMMRKLAPSETDNSDWADSSYHVDDVEDQDSQIGITDEPDSLSESFLSQCEVELKDLKMQKSELAVSNQVIREEARSLSKEMHLRGRDVLSLSIHSLKKRSKELPNWWDPQIAEDVCRTIIGKDTIIGVDTNFTRHLNAVRDSLKSISVGRHSLSKILKEVVEGGHNTLLTIVEGEMDVSEAYASFHNALSRLPPLSKDHIHACIDEMKILVEAVDAMAQSEIEALTVVWEANSVSSHQRGNFWEEVEESTQSFQAKTDTLFETVRNCSADIEEWVFSASKDASKVDRQLHTRLLKLKTIHDEVEKLRSKQDSKSKIMSLDSEIRILSAKLAEFEEKACSRQRLTTKKMNSATLLKEERFRKQMQGAFTTKLKALGILLQDWEKSEGKHFDATLLSDDVRTLLTTGGEFGSLVEERTAFMHLKTVKQKIRRRPHIPKDTRLEESTSRPVSSSSERSRQRLTTPAVKTRDLSPSTKSTGSSMSSKSRRTASPALSRQQGRENRILHTSSKGNKKVGLRNTTTKGNDNTMKTSSKRKVEKRDNLKGITIATDKPTVVTPFGNVLAGTPTEKENRRF